MTEPLYFPGALDEVYQMDALELLKALPDASVDCFFIDPPYGNNNGVGDLADARAKDKVKGGRQRGTITPIANDSPEAWATLMQALLPEINRTLKPSGGCCCCVSGGGPNVNFAQLSMWLDTYHDFFQAVIWDKSARGYGLGWRYRRNYEFIMVSHKRGGKLKWNEARKAQPNVIYFPPTSNEHHPTEKPVALVDWFLLNHTERGDLVVDCFMGSGTTLVSAKHLGRRFIGSDLSAEYVAVAKERLAQPHTLSFMNILDSVAKDTAA